jgi:hypothetical protein
MTISPFGWLRCGIPLVWLGLDKCPGNGRTSMVEVHHPTFDLPSSYRADYQSPVPRSPSLSLRTSIGRRAKDRLQSRRATHPVGQVLLVPWSEYRVSRSRVAT